MLVVACNTSSAVALDAIASDTMVPVIGGDRAGRARRGEGLAQWEDRSDRHRGDDRVGRLYAGDSAPWPQVGNLHARMSATSAAR